MEPHRVILLIFKYLLAYHLIAHFHQDIHSRVLVLHPHFQFINIQALQIKSQQQQYQSVSTSQCQVQVANSHLAHWFQI